MVLYGYIMTLLESEVRNAPCDQPCDVTEGEHGLVFQWIYDDSSLKWHCVGCRHPITKLTTVPSFLTEPLGTLDPSSDYWGFG